MKQDVLVALLDQIDVEVAASDVALERCARCADKRVTHGPHGCVMCDCEEFV